MSKSEPQPSNCGKLEKRSYLTDIEVEKLIHAAKSIGRHQHRDGLMLLMAYRHGLRVSELTGLRWDQVHLDEARIHIERMKKGDESMQPISGEELRALRKLKREYPNSAFVFVSERGGPLTRFTINDIVERAGKLAGFEFSVNPHMLRHSCGHQLAAKGVDTRAIQGYLGHKNIQHTVRYTKLAANRFKDFGKLI